MQIWVAFAVALFAVPALAQQDARDMPAGVTERELTLGKGQWAIPAIVTLPLSRKTVPAVVLLHGFGPGSVDADVGPNKIFRETAWNLARRGVASMRFEKRTSAHARLFRERGAHATVAEEWLDDALAAVATLRRQPEVDPRRIFVAGHSASAALAPRIALETAAAGAILVSGGSSSFQSPGAMIRDQANYVASLSPDNQVAVDEAHKVALEARRLDDPLESRDSVVLGHPLWYWRQLSSFDPVADIRMLTRKRRPVLIVQGGRDYLVGPVQWRGWEATLGSNPAVTRRLLPNLNHMMQPGTGKMRPEEYGERRPIAPAFTDLVAHWVLRGK